MIRKENKKKLKRLKAASGSHELFPADKRLPAALRAQIKPLGGGKQEVSTILGKHVIASKHGHKLAPPKTGVAPDRFTVAQTVAMLGHKDAPDVLGLAATRWQAGQCIWCGEPRSPKRWAGGDTRIGLLYCGASCQATGERTMMYHHAAMQVAFDSITAAIDAFWKHYIDRMNQEPVFCFGGLNSVLEERKIDLSKVSAGRLAHWASFAGKLKAKQYTNKLKKLSNEAAEWVLKGAMARGIGAAWDKNKEQKAARKAELEERRKRRIEERERRLAESKRKREEREARWKAEGIYEIRIRNRNRQRLVESPKTRDKRLAQYRAAREAELARRAAEGIVVPRGGRKKAKDKQGEK